MRLRTCHRVTLRAAWLAALALACLTPAWADTSGPRDSSTSVPPADTPIIAGSPDPTPSAEASYGAVYDPVREQLVVYGATGADFWTLSLADAPVWVRHTGGGTSPPPIIGHSMIYDPVRDRVIVYGGVAGGLIPDVWALSLAEPPTWSRITPGGTGPSVRYLHSAIYDPVRDRMVVFGGATYAGFVNDTWALDLSGPPTWNRIVPTSASPSARMQQAAIYDPVRDRMVISGGGGASVWDDVWALSLGGSPVWTEITPAGPSPLPRYWHSAVYDPAGDRMIHFAGANVLYHNDTWSLSLGGSPAWTSLVSSTPPPSTRSHHAAVLDAPRYRMVVFGGYGYGGGVNDTWVLPLDQPPAWSRLETLEEPLPTAPIPIFTEPVAGIPATIHLGQAFTIELMVGNTGTASDDGRIVVSFPALTDAADAQRVSSTSDGDQPGFRLYAAGATVEDAACQPLTAPYLVTEYADDSWSGFGGETNRFRIQVRPPAAGAFTVDIRATMHVSGPYCELVTGLPDEGEAGSTDAQGFAVKRFVVQVLPVPPPGTAPEPRHSHVAIHDPARDRMVTFGGWTGSPSADTWALSLDASPVWSLILADNPPAGRDGHSAIYDPVRDRMIVFGGPDNDVWALSLSGSPAWTRIETGGDRPPPRRYHAAIYDPVRDRMVIAAGVGASPLLDTWALSLGDAPAWTRLENMTTGTGSIVNPGAAYDPVRDRMIVFGTDNGQFLWALTLPNGGWSRIIPATPDPVPPFHDSHALIYDPAGDRLWVVSGASQLPESDVWTFSLASRTWERVGTWGTRMPARMYHTVLLDPAGDRFVAHAGAVRSPTGLDAVGDTWFLSRSVPPTWQQLGAPPPPPPPSGPFPVFTASVTGLPSSIVIGETFQFMVGLRNDGATTDDGRITITFPSFTDSADGEWVHSPAGDDVPGYLEFPAGATLIDQGCQPISASQFAAEYADSSWQGFGIETNTATLFVQPRAVGTFYFLVRAAMHQLGGPRCALVHALPDGGEAGFTDQQGWPVKRFAVTVLPPTQSAGPVFTAPIEPLPTSIILGQRFTVTIDVENVGAVSDDGRIVVGFPSFTSATDGQYVGSYPSTDTPGYREFAAGSALADSACGSIVATYLNAEYEDRDWRGFGDETNTLFLTVEPRAVGPFHLYVRSTMRSAGLPGCSYVNAVPMGGEDVFTDQQGWSVRRFTVDVQPPPTEPQPTFTFVMGPPVSAEVNQAFTISMAVRNDGAASDDGRIVVGFPQFPDVGDAGRVGATYGDDSPGYRETRAGTALADSLCQPLTASYLVAEYADSAWAFLGEEVNELTLTVTPRTLGPFYVDVRSTMHSLGAGPCAYVNAIPSSAGNIAVDQQGWMVRRFTVSVVPSPPPVPAFPAGVTLQPVARLIIGETMTLTTTVRNNGARSIDGRAVVSFPDLTQVSDSAFVAPEFPIDGDTPGYRELPAGSTLTDHACQTIPASYLTVEYADDSWETSESQTITLLLRPRELGPFRIQVRATMEALPCTWASAVPGGGPLTTDQQGWYVTVFTIQVDPPPPTAPVFTSAVSGIPSGIELGENFMITASVRNDGTASNDGRISFGFPTFTDPEDAQWALSGTTGDQPGYVEYPAGTDLLTATCGTILTDHLVVEYMDDAWLTGESNTVSVVVRPREQGTFFIDIRTTMRDTLNAAPCVYRNAVPANGAAVVDAQGWEVRRFAVVVGPPPGPPTTNWWPITPSTAGPSPRTAATAAYHAARQALIVYGGGDPIYRGDTWSLPLDPPGAWTQLAPGGPVPQRRIMHTMIYNPIDDQMVIFGGFYDDFLNDMTVLALSGAPWWFPNPGHGAPPPPRGGHTAVYDPIAQRMLVMGGYDGTLRGDVWEYAPPGVGTWRQLTVSGTAPPPRAQHATIFDPVRNRMIVIGGDVGVFANDVWALNLAGTPTWEPLAPTGAAPSPRREHTATYDPVGDRVVLYGGFDGTRKDDIWALSLGTEPAWTRLRAAGLAPTARFGHAAAYDAPRRRMVIFGGNAAPGGLSGEVWALQLDYSTPVTVALASVEATPERVRLAWTFTATGPFRTEVSRALEGSEEWLVLGSAAADGDRLVYEDRAVAQGQRYGYRLTVWEGSEATEVEAAWVTVPRPAVLSLAGAFPNPSEGELEVGFSLAGAEAASLELFDLKGRRVAAREVGALGPGEHRLRIEEARGLPAGVYLVRLTQQGRKLTTKACLVR